MRTTTANLESDGLLPVTNLPLGSITAQAEYLTTQHPGELTVAEFHGLPERYERKIVQSRAAFCGWCSGDVKTCCCYDEDHASAPHPSNYFETGEK